MASDRGYFGKIFLTLGEGGQTLLHFECLIFRIDLTASYKSRVNVRLIRTED